MPGVLGCEALAGEHMAQVSAAIVAESCPEVIFAAALFTMIAHFSLRHCDKQTTCPLDNLDVPDYELIVDSHRTEAL